MKLTDEELGALRWCEYMVKGVNSLDVATVCAALRRAMEPVPMLLYCPACGQQHIDRDDPTKDATGLKVHSGILGDAHWKNPPHRSHLCNFCGHIWRPSDHATTGVASIETKGENDCGNCNHA